MPVHGANRHQHTQQVTELAKHIHIWGPVATVAQDKGPTVHQDLFVRYRVLSPHSLTFLSFPSHVCTRIASMETTDALLGMLRDAWLDKDSPHA